MTYTIRRRPILGLAPLAGVLAAMLLPTLSHATTSSRSGEIAFSARVRGISQVFTIRPDGTGVRQVTHGRYDVGQFGLTWSPDGRNLLYTVSGNGTSRPDEMARSRANGNNATVISPPCTGNCLGDSEAVYSPDGTKIAFVRAFGPITNGNASAVGIFTMNANGSHLKQLTQTATPTSSEDHQPSWSPNGKEIVFVRINTTATPSKESAIEVMNADGSNIQRLTPWRIRANDPRWSPNGKQILFNTYAVEEAVQFKSANLFTMHPDGTHRVQLTHYAGGTLQAFADDWSPDGTQIVFRRMKFSGCCTEVGGYYILNLRTKQIRQLTPVRIRNDAQAAWGR